MAQRASVSAQIALMPAQDETLSMISALPIPGGSRW